MYTSGQIGLNPETGDLVPGGIGPQAEQVMRKLFLWKENIPYLLPQV